MQYIKHYYVDDDNNTFCCEVLPKPKYKRHPWKEYAGLDVKVWLSDSDGVDVCLAELPDSTSVSTIVDDCGKKSIQVLTEDEYNVVAISYFEATALFLQASEEKQSGNEVEAEVLIAAGNLKMNEATTALYAL